MKRWLLTTVDYVVTPLGWALAIALWVALVIPQWPPAVDIVPVHRHAPRLQAYAVACETWSLSPHVTDIAARTRHLRRRAWEHWPLGIHARQNGDRVTACRWTLEGDVVATRHVHEDPQRD